MKNNNTQRGWNNFTSFWESTSKMYLLNLRNHFVSNSVILSNFILPILILISTGVLFPITFGFTWATFLSLNISAFSAFGTIFFTFRRSTLNKNINMMAVSSATIYTSILVTLLTITFITNFILIIGLFLFTYLGIFSSQFSFVGFVNFETVIDWSKINWSIIAIYWIESTLITYSISFMLMQFIVSQKTFFLFFFTYIIASIFFGGIMSQTWIVNDGHIIMPPRSDDGKFIPGILPAYQYGQPLWWFGQLFPHFQANQFLSFSLLHGIKGSELSEIDLIKNNDFTIQYYSIMPIIQITFYLFVGAMLTFDEDK